MGAEESGRFFLKPNLATEQAEQAEHPTPQPFNKIKSWNTAEQVGTESGRLGGVWNKRNRFGTLLGHNFWLKQYI